VRVSRTSTAAVVTDRPARYGKQLVSHLTRRASGEWSDDAGTGTITFEGGAATLTAGEGVLTLVVDGDDLDRLEDVVGRHLVRFGTKDELVVRWQRGDGTEGTQQRNAGDADTRADERSSAG
jgi:uncharacterized protein